MAAKNSVGSTAWKILLGFLVSLLIIVLVAELGLRWFLSSRIAKDFDLPGQEQVSVSFGSSPLVLGLLNKELPELELDLPSTLTTTSEGMSGQPAMQVELNGVTTGEKPIVRSLRSTAFLPDDYLLSTLQTGIAQQSGLDVLGDIVITDISSSAAANALEVEFGGGLARLTLAPRTQDGALAFEVTNSRLLAWDLPADVTATISDALSHGVATQLTGGDLTMDQVRVEDGHVELTITGTNVDLGQLSQTYEQLGTNTHAETNTPAETNAHTGTEDS